MANTTPRSAVGRLATPALPKVNVSRTVNAGKKSPAKPQLKTLGSLSKPSPNPKPKVPNLVKPLGPSTGEENPQLTPRNSPRGVKQRIGLKNPMSAL